LETHNDSIDFLLQKDQELLDQHHSPGKDLVCVIAGDRDATYEHTMAVIESCPFKHRIRIVVSGKCRGADTNGEFWASFNGIPVISMPANWDKHGKAAGPIRNGEMALVANSAIIVPRSDETLGNGSMDMMKKMAAKLGREKALALIWPPPSGLLLSSVCRS
jgi:hypothetical protein